MSANVLLPIAILHTRYCYEGGNLIGLVHTHPAPGQGYHNDFPSNNANIYGGDRLVFSLLGYSELYVVPYQRCANTPIIIAFTDQSSWCDRYISN